MSSVTSDRPAPRPEVWEALDDVMSSVPAQADLLPTIIDKVRPQAASLVSGGLPQVRRAYLVGCGDSYYAAYGAQLAFERSTSLDTVAIEAMEFARYKAPFIGPESLVVPISSGGHVMRTVEAAEVATEAGAHVVLITARADSPFGRLGLPMIDQYAEPPAGSGAINALGLVNYMASFASLVVLGTEFGSARAAGDAQTRATIVDALAGAAVAIRETVDRHLGGLRAWVRANPLESFFILGAGPSYGAAAFVAAKFFEAPQFAASVQQMEEWAHEQFFTHRTGRQVMILAPRGASSGRAAEILVGIQRVGGIGLVVSDEPSLLDAADVPLQIPTLPGGELLSPLVSVVPGEILAIAYQEARGRLERTEPGLRELQHTVSQKQIGDSHRVTLADLS